MDADIAAPALLTAGAEFSSREEALEEARRVWELLGRVGAPAVLVVGGSRGTLPAARTCTLAGSAAPVQSAARARLFAARCVRIPARVTARFRARSVRGRRHRRCGS